MPANKKTIKWRIKDKEVKLAEGLLTIIVEATYQETSWTRTFLLRMDAKQERKAFIAHVEKKLLEDVLQERNVGEILKMYEDGTENSLDYPY